MDPINPFHIKDSVADPCVAAPEMLAALYEAQSTLDFIEASDSFVESRDAARDALREIRHAIAKATGEEVDHE